MTKKGNHLITNEENLEMLKEIIYTQLKLIGKANQGVILPDKLSKVLIEYGKIIILSLREEREQIRNLSIETMSDKDILIALKEELGEEHVKQFEGKIVE